MTNDERRPTGLLNSADVAPVVHGRWIVATGMIENAICSNCERHFQSYYEMYHYCPNCGAKMDIKNGDGGDAAENGW